MLKIQKIETYIHVEGKLIALLASVKKIKLSEVKFGLKKAKIDIKNISLFTLRNLAEYMKNLRQTKN